MERRRRLLHLANAAARWVEIEADTTALTFSRDRDDDAFFHAALAANALRAVSGDRDLLDVRMPGELRIVSPRQALDDCDPTAGRTR